MSILEDLDVIPRLQSMAERLPGERITLLATIAALRLAEARENPQTALPGMEKAARLPSYGKAANLIVYATEAKSLALEVRAMGEVGETMPSDALLMRAAVTYGMLVRFGMMPPIEDAVSRAHAVATIANNFQDDPPSTPERAKLFATKLEVEHG